MSKGTNKLPPEKTLSNARVFRVFDRAMAEVEKGRKPNIAQIMREEGYSDWSAHALKVTQTVTWKELMAQVNDEVVLSRVYDIMMQKKDQRTALSAADILLKLKDRYPASKIKHSSYDEREKYLVE